MTGAALLVRCNVDEADKIRAEAHKEHRTISGYVLNIAVKAVAADDRLFSKLNHDPANEFMSRRSPIVPGQRTAILVRCAATEADRIRQSARHREIPINAFILQALKGVWNQQVPRHVG
jgi:uncharacterized protein (DUF1778 family)